MGKSIEFPATWTAALNECNHVVPMNSAEIAKFIDDIAQGLTDALAEDPARAVKFGAQLAGAHFVGDEALGRSIAAIQSHFAPPVDDVRGQRRLAELLKSFSSGYVGAFRRWILSEQESLRAADVSARRAVEGQLRASEARLRAVFAQAGVGTAISDVSGRILEANAAFANMLGYGVDEFCATVDVADLAHPEDDDTVWKQYSQLIAGEIDGVRIEKPYLRRDGSTVWTNLNVSLVRDQDDLPQYTLVLVEDISEQRELREQLQHRASHDNLTGLPNRAQFFDALSNAFADPESRVGVCYIDLDHFKIVNDTYGHDFGDQVLTAVAHRLRECGSEPGQLVARMGGDEFVILVAQSTGSNDVVEMADSVLKALVEPFDIGGHRLTMSVSIGVMEERVDRMTATDLVKAADTTMYWAKDEGRNRLAFFDRERSSRQQTRYALSLAMRDALDNNEFFVDYQPIVGLADETMFGVEALVRWQHPTMGRLAPDRFIDLADENGLIGAIDAFVLEQSCRDCKLWQNEFGGRAPFVSVNLASRQVSDPTLAGRVAATISSVGLEPRSVQLELTEQTFMQTDRQSVESLRALSAFGVAIAIDDFGTGYSNLAYLGQLPVDVLKLAGPFVTRMDGQGADRSTDELIVKSIIDLAHNMGISVTAECVETEDQARRLAALGCDSAQGWHFARPTRADRIVELLQNANP
ncbi:putative bifunctional diguanylate cyclase/phosphodiesterase [Antrihabitans cavernicola]|uniref:EAL domain-containing protein n=1 Tax=Antrihabitans cavernicola TaxID=2495913 RepID=A0A5A7S6K9_9NOCA|nr:bifunctional diguanylate cyclase/phosphodiesterase [Spelaeibacter cavernicola]KAA0019489.1 EAL domain-containing protein [Spelaeibacter cavernicola]